MRRCPMCGRTFSKDTQKFCTFDGGALIPAAIDPNPTITDTPEQNTNAQEQSAMEAPTRAISQDLKPPSPPPFDPNATVASFKVPRAETGPGNQTAYTSPPPPSPPMVPPAVRPAAPPMFVPPATARKKSKMPLILGVLVVLLFLGLAGLAAGYFFVLRPMIEAKNRAVPIAPEAANQNLNANVEVQTPVENKNANSNTETEPAFVPPAGAIEFVNSNSNLDGKLAEHYLDFSFYYPKSWARDPQAGVPGASNFVKVERRLPPDLTQEISRWAGMRPEDLLPPTGSCFPAWWKR